MTTSDGFLREYKAAICKIIGTDFLSDNRFAPKPVSGINSGSDDQNTGWSGNYTDNYTDNYNETSRIDETQTEKADGDITSSFSAGEIRLLNLFLSNFAEAGVREVSPYDNKGMTDFVIVQALINSQEKIRHLGSGSFSVGNVRYNRSISCSYVEERRERYFGTRGNNSSTDKFYCESGYYYIPDDTANVSSYFSKLDKAVSNGDGTITVYFTSYDCRGLAVNVDIYKGTGTANIGKSRRIGAGEAVLESKYLGEKYANYIVKNYKLTQGRDYEYRNTLVTSAEDNVDSLPSELKPYERYLRKEGRNYKTSWNMDLNYRSEPVSDEVLDGNWDYKKIGELEPNTIIYVEYIYEGFEDDPWAVFKIDGRYAFVPIYSDYYDSNGNRTTLIDPV